MQLMGDARSELFHYEVRATYDTPEQAESRRVVDQALRGSGALDFGGGYDPDDDSEGDEPWRG
jgi:hypothetical protein